MYQAIVFLPLIGFLIVGLFGTSLGAKASEYITSGLVVVSAALSWVAFFSVGFSDVETFTVPLLRWLQTGGLDAAGADRGACSRWSRCEPAPRRCSPPPA